MMKQARHTAYSADEYYESSRMFHRYRIPNLRRYERSGVIEASHQMQLNFPEDRRDLFLTSLASVNSADELERQRRVIEAAYYDYDTMRSSLERGSIIPRTQYEMFYARHEEPGKRIIVRLANTDVMNPLRVYRFRVFRWLGDDPDVYLVCTQHRIADSFLKRFRKDRADWTVEYSSIDLQRMTAEGRGIVRNGTFGNTKGRPNLSSMSLSGYKVNEDSAWLDASRIGQLNSTIVQNTLEGQDINMMVTERGSIMIYGVEDIETQLALVTQAYETIVKQYEIKPPRLLTPSRKKSKISATQVSVPD